jgi:phosphatidylglycerol:prolipoprotein diacylglycerol transferase
MNEFWNWWQHLPEHISPVLFQVGPVKVQYYGLMYIVAFAVTYMLVMVRLKRHEVQTITTDQVQSLFTAMVIGLLVGARIGYVLFYNFSYYLRHPLEIVLPFDFSNGMAYTGIAGMSFHGGLIGVIMAVWLYIRKAKIDFFQAADLIVPAIPLGYTFGRVGNFINGELYGRVTLKPWGMYFPTAPTNALRHPSQLYEAFFEGIFLFGILWFLRKHVRTSGAMLALYLIGYGLVRFAIEFFRQPDSHLGFVMLRFSMGQILCALMILAGLILLVYLGRRQALAD